MINFIFLLKKIIRNYYLIYFKNKIYFIVFVLSNKLSADSFLEEKYLGLYFEASMGYSHNTASTITESQYTPLPPTTSQRFRHANNDNGHTWQVERNNLSNANITSLLATKNTLYAGTEKGIFISTNAGDSWQKVSQEPISSSNIRTY